MAKAAKHATTAPTIGPVLDEWDGIELDPVAERDPC